MKRHVGSGEAWRDFRSGIPDRREADDLCRKRRLGEARFLRELPRFDGGDAGIFSAEEIGSIFSIWGGWLHAKRSVVNRPNEEELDLALRWQPSDDRWKGLERLGSLRARVTQRVRRATPSPSSVSLSTIRCRCGPASGQFLRLASSLVQQLRRHAWRIMSLALPAYSRSCVGLKFTQLGRWPLLPIKQTPILTTLYSSAQWFHAERTQESTGWRQGN